MPYERDEVTRIVDDNLDKEQFEKSNHGLSLSLENFCLVKTRKF